MKKVQKDYMGRVITDHEGNPQYDEYQVGKYSVMTVAAIVLIAFLFVAGCDALNRLRSALPATPKEEKPDETEKDYGPTAPSVPVADDQPVSSCGGDKFERIDGKHVYAATNARGHWMIWMKDDRPPIEKLLRGPEEITRENAEAWLQWWDEHADYWITPAVSHDEYRQMVEALRTAGRYIEGNSTGVESTRASSAVWAALEPNRRRSIKASGGSDTEWIISATRATGDSEASSDTPEPPSGDSKSCTCDPFAPSPYDQQGCPQHDPDLAPDPLSTSEAPYKIGDECGGDTGTRIASPRDQLIANHAYAAGQQSTRPDGAEAKLEQRGDGRWAVMIPGIECVYRDFQDADNTRTLLKLAANPTPSIQEGDAELREAARTFLAAYGPIARPGITTDHEWIVFHRAADNLANLLTPTDDKKEADRG